MSVSSPPEVDVKLAKKPTNWNVVFALAGYFFQGMATNMMQAIVSPLLVLLTAQYAPRETLFVGLAEGVPSVVSVLVAFPAGFLSDKTKSTVVKDSGGLIVVLAYFCLASMGVVFSSAHPEAYWMVFGGLCAANLGIGIGSGPVQGMLQNSIHTQERTRVMAMQSVLNSLGGMMGPLTIIILATSLNSEEWSLEDLRMPWVGACTCYVLMAGSFLQLSKKRLLGIGSEGKSVREVVPDNAKLCGCFSVHSLPFVKVVSDLMFAVASGMTIKFFPLWLKTLGISLIGLNLVLAAQLLSVALLSILLKKLSERLGRIEMVLASKLIGLTLFALILIGRHFYWQILPVMATLHVLRSGFMNAPSSLMSAIENDYVRHDIRGTWNAITVLSGFGWSASAVLGGYVLSEMDYEYLFAITFSMQIIAMLPIFLMYLIIRRSKKVKLAALAKPSFSVNDSSNELDGNPNSLTDNEERN